jgi:hypothetical protein
VHIRQALDAKAITLMALLCVIWGLQQVVLKATAADIAPVMQIALRSGVAALLVGLVMWWRKEPMNLRDGTLRPGVAVAIFFGLFVACQAAVRRGNYHRCLQTQQVRSPTHSTGKAPCHFKLFTKANASPLKAPWINYATATSSSCPPGLASRRRC